LLEDSQIEYTRVVKYRRVKFEDVMNYKNKMKKIQKQNIIDKMNSDYMIYSVRIKCVLDTNVIYPIEIRDLLFWFVNYDLFTLKWSAHIFDECKDVMMRKGVSEEEVTKSAQRANIAFPDALVKNY
jgi:hypothetical protein